MRRSLLLPLLLAGALMQSGCAASLAASAIGAAVRAATPDRPEVTYDLRETASAACRARAARDGEVRIIDSEQRSDGRVTVWGIVQDARQRRSFECTYDRRVVAFELRPIRTQ